MQKYKIIKGNLITKALNGEFDVIVHGCNCFCSQKSGLAPQMVKVFNTDKFGREDPIFKGDINKLGHIDYQYFKIEKGLAILEKYPEYSNLAVINAYTQYYNRSNNPIPNSTCLEYDALSLCMMKINHIFKGKHIGLPKIGAGLAGGDWNIIEQIIKKQLKDCNVTIVEYDGN